MSLTEVARVLLYAHQTSGECVCVGACKWRMEETVKYSKNSRIKYILEDLLTIGSA